MNKLTEKDFPDNLVLRIQPTGSKYICNPPVMTTDEDYFLWGFNYVKLIDYLIDAGYELCGGSEYISEVFTALRKGDINLIVVHKKAEFEKCAQCTELAKRFNLTNKQDRVDLFELVRKGSYLPEEDDAFN